MSGRARPWQKAKELLDGLEGELPDNELAVIKRYVKRRSREAAQVTVTPVSTVHHRIPRLLTPKIPPDVCVSLKGEDEEGRMNPEPTELESPSAGTGLQTSGQQCPPSGDTWETGRTIADGYLLVGMGSNQRGDTSSPTNALESEPVQLRHLQIHHTPFFGRQVANPKTRIKSAKRTSNLTPEGKERSHRLGTRL